MKVTRLSLAGSILDTQALAASARARIESFIRDIIGEAFGTGSRAVRRIALVFLAVLCLHSSAAAKRTDDVVILINGDRMTGEVKSLDRGMLSFKADYMAEPVRLDWKKVSRVESKDHFIITLTSGNLYTGLLDLAASDRGSGENFVIRAGSDTVKVRQDEVIKFLPTGSGIFQQLNGSIDYGFGYTSGNTQYQSQLTASANYRKGDQYFSAGTSITLSGQSGGDRTARYNVDFGYRRLLRGRWFAGGLLALLSSEQQSLDLRTTVGGLIGHGIVVTDRTNFSVAAGMVVARERYRPSLGLDPRSTNVEALVGMDFYTFRFKTTDVRARLLAYPSLTVPGRMRAELDTSLKVEIFKDFYWSLSLYDNFDSKPPVNFKKNDLGISSSFGWKF